MSRPGLRISLVVLVLLLAAATRILGAEGYPLWTDEGASLYHAPDPVRTLANNHHPPLYFMALNAWMSVAGDSRIALRFPAILAGILSAAAVYRLGKDWTGHRAAR